jgi:hypothetical protein
MFNIFYFSIFILLISKELFVINYESIIILAEIILALFIYKNTSPILKEFFINTSESINNNIILIFSKIIDKLENISKINIFLMEEGKNIDFFDENVLTFTFDTNELYTLINIINEDFTKKIKDDN